MTYSHLNYNSDYHLDIVVSATPSGGRKFIFTQTRHKIQVPVLVKGSMVAETSTHSGIHGTMKTPIDPISASYSGSIVLNNPYAVEGKLTYQTESKYNADGKMSEKTDIKMLVEGRKDYTKVIAMLEDLIEIRTPNTSYHSSRGQ